jgi:hypothetical protein
MEHDWNRTRLRETINCPTCKAAADEKSCKEAERHRKREALLSKAFKIAEERYLARWLAIFANKSKKEAWLLYTGGSGYPALGTFYKHVKEEGVDHYLRWSFSSDFRSALHKMNVVDKDIQELKGDLELAPPAGVEPTTYRLGGGRSIH